MFKMLIEDLVEILKTVNRIVRDWLLLAPLWKHQIMGGKVEETAVLQILKSGISSIIKCN